MNKRRSRTKASTRGSLLEERRTLARELSAGPTTTVTLRVPTGLNEWLDAYVHGAWPQKVRKQQLVTEALRMLIARRGGPGQEVFETELFGDGSYD